MIARILQAFLAGQGLIAAAFAAWLISSDRAWAPYAIALGLLLPLAVQSLVIGIECLIAWSVNDAPPGERGHPGTWLRAWVSECVASIRTFNLAQPLLGHLPVSTAPISEHPDRVPVLLIHGYFCNRALWRPMARVLAARGHAVDAIDLEPPFASIDRYAPQIDAAVRALAVRTGASKVALVCHSMGGLAARAWMRAHGHTRACALITLGSPHRGTLLAAYGHGRNVRQMRRDSDWLRALQADEATAQPIRTVKTLIIRTWQDNIVAPQSPQTLPGAQTLSFSGLGHVGLVYHHGVQQAVIDALHISPEVFRPQK
jgi:triacylglycerol esterase/lipase EstA (alpha/beta hydrolase family)